MLVIDQQLYFTQKPTNGTSNFSYKTWTTEYVTWLDIRQIMLWSKNKSHNIAVLAIGLLNILVSNVYAETQLGCPKNRLVKI